MPAASWVRVLRTGLVAGTLATALATALTACGTASEPSPPGGVDGLVIPTPEVDPDDFVEGVDNPWLPLTPGSSSSYDVTGEVGGVPTTGTLTVSVREETDEVAGVAATVVDSSGPLGQTTDFYAQDRDGNVWWLGRDGVWEAGVGGAEAGLAMPRRPRLGDGWRTALLPGVVEDLASVVSVDGSATTPAGSYDELVEIARSTELGSQAGHVDSYARGVGLVRSVGTDSTDYTQLLVARG